ncbi:protein-methionine-sulfoxide reductase catalytic subunit MsrP [Reinekea thalattae]|uniref:Protein-methionine-sulfoxide reductase catalytic subunit MsrP n=1 Tax=Reinekea thalattae TaxID=2593301 RepID=A0A5C8Z3M3_9GAMM|nr:protein-methionine-sulfoxide reductase catalytic subunit MsrP [Reinekea thalattae]TXR51530.1 protein-methionine-sulfoxide reductase catalytic subunit MsrP [Reinekea thalattae]
MARKFSESEQNVTPKDLFLNRRQIMKGFGAVAAASALPGMSWAAEKGQPAPAWLQNKVKSTVYRSVTADDGITDASDARQYNNFYEFGTSKQDPSRYAHEFNPYPWEIEVTGECLKPGKISLEDLLSSRALEERIYRLRCVEAWSMVIPWTGLELGSVLKSFQPTSKAKYVAFESIVRPSEFRGQKSIFSSLNWPYIEGLRMDEAMHPLAFLAVGMYGEPVPAQNGAPIRLLVPWKYGFKSIKSIVRIRFTETEPHTTWNLSNPSEYGFYSIVNPNQPHPRWSQANERRIGPNGDVTRIPTQLFNGYSEVAELYRDMDLSKYM